MHDIRQQSTHLHRERQGYDTALEANLERWGEWLRTGVHGVSYSPATPIYQAMQFRLQATPGRLGKINATQTRSIQRVIPGYFVHRRMAELDRFIRQMELPLKKILRYRYAGIDIDGVYYEAGRKEIAELMGWTVATYSTRISEARRIIRNNTDFGRK